MAWPFMDTNQGLPTDLFGGGYTPAAGRTAGGQGVPASGNDGHGYYGPGGKSDPNGGFGSNGSIGGVGTSQNGGLDLNEANRIRQMNGSTSYGGYNTEALGQYNGGANDLASHYSQQGAAAQGRQGEQINNVHDALDRSQNAYSRGQQEQSLGLMRNAAMGNAPSQAQMQMRQGLDQSLAGQIAAANSSRGGGANIAMAQRNAAAGGAQMQNQVMGQSAALRAQEMAQARGAYGSAADQLRASNQAAYGQDQAGAFQQAGLNAAQRAQNDAYQQGYDQMGLSALQGQQSSDTAKYGADRNVSIANSQQQASNVNAGISAGAGLLTAAAIASDINLKSNISSDSPALSSFAGGGGEDARTKQPYLTGGPADARTGPRGQTTQLFSQGLGGGNIVSPGGNYPGVVSPGGNYPGASAPGGNAGQMGAPSASQGLGGFASHRMVLPGELGRGAMPAGGAAAAGAGGAAGTSFMSDERAKVGGRAADETDRFLDSLHPSSYTYKNPGDEPSMSPSGGRYLGIMAQDVEKSPTGGTIVQNTPGGKMIDGKPMISALAAGAGRLNERQNELAAELAALKASKGKK